MASESGPWSICRFDWQGDSDIPNHYIIVKWGFDSQDEAARELSRVAQEEDLPEQDLAIVYTIFPHDLAHVG
jgi:hypothetical protein